MRDIRNTCTLLFGLALLLGGPKTLSADMVTTYHENLQDWTSGTSNVRQVDFELGRSLKYGTYEIFNSMAGLNLQATGALPGEGPVNFNSLYLDGSGNTKYNMYIVNPDSSAGTYWGSGMMLQGTAYQAGQETRIRVTLPAGGMTSVGMDLRSADDSGQSFKVILYKDADFVPFFTADSLTTQTPGTSLLHSFWGATSDVAITRIDIILKGNISTATVPILDNFRYGEIAAGTSPIESPTESTLPEPATGPLYLTLGGFALAASRLRKWWN